MPLICVRFPGVAYLYRGTEEDGLLDGGRIVCGDVPRCCPLNAFGHLLYAEEHRSPG